MNEFRQWWLRRAEMFNSRSGQVTAAALAVLLLVGIVPWQSTIRIPAVVEALDESSLYAPAVSQVEMIHVAQGDYVNQGDPIITLQSAEVENGILSSQRRIELVTALLNRIVADAGDRSQKVILESELRQWQGELAGFQEQAAALHIVAPIDGVVASLSTGLHEGRWLAEQAPVGLVISNEGARIRGYVSAVDLGRLDEGAAAVFIPDVPEQDRIEGAISVVSGAHAETLTIPELTSYYDGAIAVNKVENDLQPLKAWYKLGVNVETTFSTVGRAVPGLLLAEGKAESLASRFWRRAVHVVLREIII